MRPMATKPITSGHILHWARLYDLGTGLLGGRIRALHQRLLELAAVAPGERVLDVGCGPGRLTLGAAQAAGPSGEAMGIDPSPEMIDVATHKAARAAIPATFRIAPIEAIPAEDGHFDVVLANLMLHHLPAELQRRGFAEVMRVLAPNGRFVVGDFSAAPGHGPGHILAVLGLRRGSEHAEHMRGLALAAGFEEIQIHATASRAFCVLVAKKPGAQNAAR